MGGCCCYVTAAADEEGEDRNASHVPPLRQSSRESTETASTTVSLKSFVLSDHKLDLPLPPAPSAVDSPVLRSHSSRSLECCICLDAVTIDTKAILSPCSHSEFHESCVSSWMQRVKPLCPLCDHRVDSVIYALDGCGGSRIKPAVQRQTSSDLARDLLIAHQFAFQ